MKTLKVTVGIQSTALPSGVTYDHTDVAITDASGAPSKQALNGSESPPWVATFSVADGVGSGSATAMDNAGNPIGNPIPFSFGTAIAMFPAPVGVTVELT